MHRIEGDDVEVDGNGTGRDGYRDASPPSIAATILTAEAMNAIQEEIAMLIEETGLTLNANAEDDRSNGWGQLIQAIFGQEYGTTTMLAANSVDGDRLINGSVDDAKINTVSFDKCTGELSQTTTSGGDTSTMDIKFAEFILNLQGASGNDYEVKLNRTTGFHHLIDNNTGPDYECNLNAHGLSFFGGPKFAHKEVAFTSANFTDSFDRSIAYIDTGVSIADWDGVSASVSYEDSALPGIGSYSAPNRYNVALKFGPTRFTAPTGSSTWIAVVVFLDNAFYTDGDSAMIDKKALFTFRKV